MKKYLAVIFMLLVMTSFCGCKKEAEMVEDAVSTVMSENKNNGDVTDNDGYIGNEDRHTTENRRDTTNSSSGTDNDNVL